MPGDGLCVLSSYLKSYFQPRIVGQRSQENKGSPRTCWNDTFNYRQSSNQAETEDNDVPAFLQAEKHTHQSKHGETNQKVTHTHQNPEQLER